MSNDKNVFKRNYNCKLDIIQSKVQKHLWDHSVLITYGEILNHIEQNRNNDGYRSEVVS